jgi:soluble lytic murein transglycosylase-like protein
MADAVNNIPLTTTSSRHLTDAQKVKLQKATREFESIFVQMMLKSMRGAQGEESNEFGGQNYGGDVMKGMFDTELSKHIGNQGKLGVAESLYRKLTGESLPSIRAAAELAANTAAKAHAASQKSGSAAQNPTILRAARAQQLADLADDTNSGDESNATMEDTTMLSLNTALKQLQEAASSLQASDNETQQSPVSALAVLQSAGASPVSDVSVTPWTATTIQAPNISLPPAPSTGTPAHAALTASAGLTTVPSRRDASQTAADTTGKSASAAMDRVKSYNAIIAHTADTVGVNANLLKAMIVEESGARQHARSSKNAKGLMQLIDTTAESMGVKNVWDPHQNIQGGARYLKQQLDKFKGDVPLALASYNAGPGNVERYNGIPPFRETRNYVKRVMNLFNAFQSMENK